jgi:hypothetical protein
MQERPFTSGRNGAPFQRFESRRAFFQFALIVEML